MLVRWRIALIDSVHSPSSRISRFLTYQPYVATGWTGATRRSTQLSLPLRGLKLKSLHLAPFLSSYCIRKTTICGILWPLNDITWYIGLYIKPIYDVQGFHRAWWMVIVFMLTLLFITQLLGCVTDGVVNESVIIVSQCWSHMLSSREFLPVMYQYKTWIWFWT